MSQRLSFTGSSMIRSVRSTGVGPGAPAVTRFSAAEQIRDTTRAPGGTLIMAMPPSAEDLQRLMQAGDAEALDRLARAYGPRLLAVARRHCRSPHDAEDAVQQALENAGAALRSYRGEGSALAWLSVLVARSCSRMNRDPRNDPLRTVHDDVERPCACEDPEAVAERRELAEVLGAALMTLSRTDRLAFLLATEGYTSEEIAAQFGLTDDAVRSRIKRARKALRAHVTQNAPRTALPRGRTKTPRGAPDATHVEAAHRRHA